MEPRATAYVTLCAFLLALATTEEANHSNYLGRYVVLLLVFIITLVLVFLVLINLIVFDIFLSPVLLFSLFSFLLLCLFQFISVKSLLLHLLRSDLEQSKKCGDYVDYDQQFGPHVIKILTKEQSLSVKVQHKKPLLRLKGDQLANQNYLVLVVDVVHSNDEGLGRIIKPVGLILVPELIQHLVALSGARFWKSSDIFLKVID